MHNVQISVIIPYFNIQSELEICLKSLYNQSFSKDLYEVIVVDDGSTKKPDKILKKFFNKIKNLKKIRLKKNRGPGIARNRGILAAQGIYLLFLDGDDLLLPSSLMTLNKLILKKNADVITFNWSYLNKKNNRYILKSMRKDNVHFTQNKDQFIKTFISMNFDGSVIYTMCKKEIFLLNKIKFPAGLHEDISVIFQIYFYAKNIFFEKRIIYLKNDRKNSIVNTLSSKRINDYFKSWLIIKNILLNKKNYLYYKTKLLKYYTKGIYGLIAIMILNNININKNNAVSRARFYKIILKKIKIFFLNDLHSYSLIISTRYDKITYFFLKYYLYNKVKETKIMTFFERKLYEKKLLD